MKVIISLLLAFSTAVVIWGAWSMADFTVYMVCLLQWLCKLFEPNKMNKNSLKEIRESLLMSKSELSKKAGISSLTISRIEEGMPCRMETKRKIILALGLKLSDKDKVFH